MGEEKKRTDADLERKLKNLEERLKLSNERVLNLQRELQLVRERHKNELREKELYALEGFVRDLIGAIDDLERAIEHLKEKNECPEVLKGIELTLNRMREVLKKHGVEEVVPQTFDHRFCEAVSTADGEEGKVLQILQKGYLLRGRLIRPARVVVGRGKG